MREALRGIVVFAGTLEGRRLSECLAEAGIRHTVCVATEYGEIVMKESPLVRVKKGRMGREEMEAFLEEGKFGVAVDATHPFAEEVTQNIKAAVEGMDRQGAGISYLRLRREETGERGSDVVYFETSGECAKALESTPGNILLTTGSKELSKYCTSEEIRRRLYVRVLPGVESILACMEQGICGKQIIAMQGPFTEEMNEAMLRQYKISCLVTKESGASGGYPEKRKAAGRMGVQVFVIGRPKEEEGDCFSGICHKLEKLCGKRMDRKGRMEIVLAGIGMGHRDCLTKEAEKAIGEADILLGAERMLEAVYSGAEKHPFYRAEQILFYLQELQEKNTWMEQKKIVVLFSGDSGFYSGCRSVYEALEKEILGGRLWASLRVMPGISSVSYLSSRIGESYQDATVYSMHGKEGRDLVRRISGSKAAFLLTSGAGDVNRLGRMLMEAGMEECEVIVGYRLSYEEERIEKRTPAECLEIREEGLYTCLVKNPYAVKRKLTHGMPDRVFLREVYSDSLEMEPDRTIPMTKEEVREVSICKLRLREGAVVYDIGSGTGSIAVEIAALSEGIQVYAVERRPEAVSLIEKNKKKFGFPNISVIEATAPEGLSGLPVASHALIGGSGGRLKEILTVLWQMNPGMRVVLHAVSMETIGEIKKMLSAFGIEGEEIVQLQVNRVKKAGRYHMMQAENPVWICAFDFGGLGGKRIK